ncbi:MAG TPA: NBR1-Ig-like domain-containing protein, partial [Terriglobales bacterium]|nr:NBR1-Ig-like domain-containing protein [Terriglobales bacterium]
LDLKPSKILVFSIVLGSLLLSACGSSTDQNGNSAEVLTEAAQIAFQALTETAAVIPPTATATTTPTQTATIPSSTPTAEGTLPTNTPAPTQQQPSGGNQGQGCLRAELTYESPADDYKVAINERFVKTWVLKNIGTCTWTQGFSLVFIQGELMGAKGTTQFKDFTSVDILPGDHITLKMTFVAPKDQGTYQGYWMLRGADGILFGLGPDGKGWFWVKIFAKH